MKIKLSQLRSIIKEEVSKAVGGFMPFEVKVYNSYDDKVVRTVGKFATREEAVTARNAAFTKYLKGKTPRQTFEGFLEEFGKTGDEDELATDYNEFFIQEKEAPAAPDFTDFEEFGLRSQSKFGMRTGPRKGYTMKQLMDPSVTKIRPENIENAMSFFRLAMEHLGAAKDTDIVSSVDTFTEDQLIDGGFVESSTAEYKGPIGVGVRRMTAKMGMLNGEDVIVAPDEFSKSKFRIYKLA